MTTAAQRVGCMFAGAPVTVEGITVDHLDGRGPRFEFRVTYAGAYSCSHHDLASLLAHHDASEITIKE